MNTFIIITWALIQSTTLVWLWKNSRYNILFTVMYLNLVLVFVGLNMSDVQKGTQQSIQQPKECYCQRQQEEDKHEQE